MAKPKDTAGKAVTTTRRDVAAASDEQKMLALVQEDSGSGFEETRREDYAIPFLTVLQDLSPQVKQKMAGYIPGAKPGMILNTVNQHLYKEVRVIPCHFSPIYIEWISRKQGGGFVKAHPPTTPLREQAVRDGASNKLPNGHELQHTAQHFVLVLDPDGSVEGALIAMKSTQLKYSRRWLSAMRAAVLEIDGKIIQPPMWAWSYKLTTEEEANEDGSWYSWNISDRQRVLDMGMYQQAKAFATTMRAGTAKVNYEELQTQPEQPRPGAETPGDLENEIDA